MLKSRKRRVSTIASGICEGRQQELLGEPFTYVFAITQSLNGNRTLRIEESYIPEGNSSVKRVITPLDLEIFKEVYRIQEIHSDELGLFDEI